MKSGKEKLKIFVTFSTVGEQFDATLEKIFLDYIKNVECANEDI